MMVYSRLEHAQIMYVCMERLLNEVTGSLLEVGICSGHVCMERLLNEVTDGLLEFGTCSGHLCMKRLLN